MASFGIDFSNINPSTANGSSIGFVIDTIESSSTTDVGFLRKILDTNTKISPSQRILAEKASETYHQNAFNALSSETRNELINSELSKYGIDNIKTLYCCSICQTKYAYDCKSGCDPNLMVDTECEYPKMVCKIHPTKADREYETCFGCLRQLCSKCEPLIITWMDAGMPEDYTCSRCNKRD